MTVDVGTFYVTALWHHAPDANGNCTTEPLQGLNNVWMILYDDVSGEYQYGSVQPLFRSGDECIAVSMFARPGMGGTAQIIGYYEVGWMSIYGWDWIPNTPFYY